MNNHHAQHHAPASSDQLAALYLRDRDTPCPSCNYNRRDGTTTICPECGSPLTIIAASIHQERENLLLAKLVLLFIALFSILETGKYVYYLGLRHAIGGGLWAYSLRPSTIILLLGALAWSVLTIYATKRWFQTKRQAATPPIKQIRSPIIATIGVIVFFDIVWIIYNWITW